jgi:hypothetical protein
MQLYFLGSWYYCDQVIICGNTVGHQPYIDGSQEWVKHAYRPDHMPAFRIKEY